MDVRRKGLQGLVSLVSAVFLAAFMAGCADDGKDGADGATGPAGAAGVDGSDGISCWDLNENGVPDLPDEDTNGDGVVNVEDCRAPGGAYDPAGLHAGFFKENPYEGTQDCLYCHGKMADEILTTGHWNWQGVATNLEGEGIEGQIHGKTDIINNFCIAVPSNEGRCTQCHIGYGWKADIAYDFQDPKNIDCLVCHDHTGTYKKAAPSAGAPDPTVDLQAVAQSVGEGDPTRQACLFCHAGAGGGDNVKHGDLYAGQANTTREYDVHMGVDNVVGGYTCVDCHGVQKVDGVLVSHGIGGMPYHSVDEGVMKRCDDCHGSAASVHVGTSAQTMVNAHPTLACQVCHIPAIAREKSTKTEWYWETAGDEEAEITYDEYGNPLYNWQKGTFVFGMNVRPELRYFDGKWNKAVIGLNDVFPKPGPAQLAYPTADRFTPGAKIYPFKKMIGNQPAADQGANWKMIVPHLFGPNGQGGPNAYWNGTIRKDWDLALQDGALYTGQFYEPGTNVFAPTEMLLSVNHEVAPKEMALGYQNGCADCHFSGQIDWEALGCSADPAEEQGACPDND